MPDFPDRIVREIGEKFGERPSALDYIPQPQHAAIRAGTATVDLTGWLQDGLDSLGTAGGGVLYLPWGTYPVLDLSIPSNVALVGDGHAKTVVKRRGTLPTGRGVVNISGSKSGFSDLAIDGQVTTPATALYSGLGDPSSSTLIANSSVRIHPGAKDINLSRFRIFHTGGYAIHIDCRTGNVYRVTIDAPDLHDNRSFLFGDTGGSEIYGSWTGGILAQGNGDTNPYALHGFTVRNGRFRRGTGNQIWSHIYGFSTLHSDFKFQGNSFQDIGRDGILVGAVVGGDVSGNTFRRIGYVCVDDTNPGAPRWLNGHWAVGLDTAGITRGVNFVGNSFVTCYGAAMDLDGFAEGSVSENTVIVPQSGEPEYAEDSISSWAANYCYGAQTSNSNNLSTAAVGVRITGNRFRNCGLGAVRLYAGRNCVVSGNTIEHPASAAVAPIILGNIGNGDNQRAGGNTVSDNDIYYTPGSMVAVVQENANGFPFTSADVNRVYGNRLHGTNVFEFYRDANSGSTTGQEFASSKAALTTASKNTLQREDGYLRAYWTSGATTKSVLSLLDRVTLSGGGYGGSLLNVSTDAVGGVIATGARTSSAFDDAILSSKLYADGFLAIAATTFNATEANLLADTVGLIRYNATSKIFEQSNSLSAGARVWSALAVSSLSGLTAGRVPFTSGASSIADSANLAWDNSARVLTVTGVTATASIVAATSFIQAAEGFYTPSASASAIGAPAGGVTALSLISVRNDGAAGLTLARTSATARQYGLGIDASGNFFVRDETASAVRLSMTTAGLVTFGSSVSIDQAGNLSASAVVSAAGANVSGTAYNSLQVPSGGLYAGLGATLDQAVYLKTFAGTPNSPGGGYGALSHRSGSTYLYWNGSAWVAVDLGSIVTSITGTANQVVASSPTGAVTLSLPQNIHSGATPTFAGVVATVFNSTATGATIAFQTNNSNFQVNGNGVVSSAGGYNAGGVNVIDASRNIYAATLQTTGVAAIGTATPATESANARLVVVGALGQSASTLATSNSNAGLTVRANASSGYQLAIGATNVDGSPYLQGLVFSGGSSASSLILQGYGGNVGVGTASPQARLHVKGSGNALPASSGSTQSAGLIQRFNDSTTAHLDIGGAGGTGMWLQVSDDTNLSVPYQLFLQPTGGTVLINRTSNDSSGAALQLAGFVSATTGFATVSTAYDSIQTANGFLGKQLTVTSKVNPGTSTVGNAVVYMDSTSNQLMASVNGGAFVDLLAAGVTSITGTANQVVASSPTGAVTLSLPQNIHSGATPTFAGVVATVFNSTATGATIAFQTNNSNFQVNGNGVVSSAGGYNAGGVNVIDASRNIYAATLQTTGVAAIGTATPATESANARLVVVGALGQSASTLATSNSNAGLTVRANASSGYQLAIGATSVDGSPYLQGLVFSGGSSASSLILQGYGGNVGVGTASPQARLHVKGSGNALPASSGSTQSAGLIQRFNDSSTAHLDIGGAAGAGMWLQVSDDTNLSVPYQLFLQPTGGTVLINRTSNDSSGAALQLAGFVSATTGFATISTAYDSIQTTNGFLGKQLTVTSKVNPGTSTVGNAVVYMDSTSNQLMASVNGGAFVDLLAAGVTSITGTANQVVASASTGAVTLSLPQNIHTGASPTFAGVVATVFNSTATGATIAFQTNNSNFQVNGNGVVSSAGGYNAGGVNVIDASRNIYAATLQTTGVASIGTASPATNARLHVKGAGSALPAASGSTQSAGLIQRFNDSSNAHLDIGGTGGAGMWLQVSDDTDLALPYQLFLQPTGGTVLINRTSNDSSGAALQLAGFVSATTGFATISTAYDSIQTANGFLGKQLTVTSKVNPGTSTAGNSVVYMDSTSNQLMASVNGGAFVNLLAPGGTSITSLNSQTGPAVSIAAGTAISVSASANIVTVTNTGVTALAGTSNQVNISGATGSITLSLPQNIHASASPTFYSLLTSDAIQSNRSTGPSIYAPNAYIQGKGLVSNGLSAYNSTQSDAGISAGSGSNGGFYVASTQVINTSGQFVGLGINMPSYGIAASAFNPYSGSQYYGQTLTSWKTLTDVRDNAGTKEYKYRTIDVRGGVVASISGESVWTAF